MQLVVACARLELDARARERVCALAASSLDWTRVLKLASWHGVRPLLWRHLQPLDSVVPRPALVELWAETEDIARHNAELATELAAISALLDREGIRALPYKGPTLAASLYGDVALREFGDLDILVPRADVARAAGLLAARGYRPEYALSPEAEAAFFASPTQYHFVLAREDSGLRVELHWKSDRDFPVESGDDAWWESHRGGFAPHELLLFLCLHGTKHYWGSLGWLVDVAEILRADPGIDGAAILARARELEGVRRAGVGLRLAEVLLDAPVPEALRALADAPGVHELADRLLPLIAEPEAPPLTPWAALRLDMASCDRLRQRLRFLGWSLFAPSLVEWSRWPLPRGLGFLYPPLRLVRLVAKYGRRAVRDA